MFQASELDDDEPEGRDDVEPDDCDDELLELLELLDELLDELELEHGGKSTVTRTSQGVPS